MLRFDAFAKIPALLPVRASTRTALALAGAAALCFAIAGPAQADDCLGGYRMIKGEIPVLCQSGPTRALYNDSASVLSGPVHTGSIGRVDQPEDTAPSSISSPNAMSNADAMCDHGMRFVATPNNGATLMIKCS